MPHFRDQSLIPTGAVRLAALGHLAEAPRSYGELAVEVRNFVSRMLGPSLDVLGMSVEVLRHEGLIEPVGPRASPGQSLTASTTVQITDAGRAELAALLAARVRAPMTDLTRLVVALKLRFLHLIDEAERRRQVELLEELTVSELARLTDLRGQRPAQGDPLGEWLDLEIAHTQASRDWLARRLSRQAKEAGQDVGAA